MKKLLVCLILGFASLTCLHAHSLTGRITNVKNEPLANVSILNASTKEHTHSNTDGIFKFDFIHTGDILQFSHIGVLSSICY